MAEEIDGRQGLLSKDARNFGDGGHLTILVEKGRLLARLQSDDASVEIVGGAVEDGRAHHVALSFGEEGMALYLDGVEVGRDAFTGGLEGNREPIVLGANSWASSSGTADKLKHGFSGRIEDAALFDGALSAREIAEWADGSGVPASESPVPTPPETVESPPRGDADGGRAGGSDEPNRAPEAEGRNASLRLEAGRTEKVDLSEFFSDPDGDELVFEFVKSHDFMQIEGKMLVLSPDAGDLGNHGVRVRATDGMAESDAFNFNLVVKDAGSDAEVALPPEKQPAPKPEPEESPVQSPGAPSGREDFEVGEKVTLKAGKNILSGPNGAQEWGKGVTLEGYTASGKLTEVVWDRQHGDHSFGVKGGRWDNQIDFTESGGGRSERLVIDFNGEVADVVVGIGMVGQDEGPGGLAETGIWTALDSRGQVVDTGLIGAEYSALGAGRAVKGSYGTYPIEIDVDVAIAALVIEATQFGHGEGNSVQTDRYGENNSDISLADVSFHRVEDTGADFL